MGRKLNGKLILSLFLISLASVSQSSTTDELEKTQPQQRLVGHGVPAGSIFQFGGEVAPNGWFICDGRRVDGNLYAELYSVIGIRYTPRDMHPPRMDREFCLPDIRGRVIVGHDTRAALVSTSNVLGSIGGEEKHQLTVAELASHQHAFLATTSYVQGISTGGANCTAVYNRVNEDTELTGGNTSHNNMQPYYVLNHIIKH